MNTSEEQISFDLILNEKAPLNSIAYSGDDNGPLQFFSDYKKPFLCFFFFTVILSALILDPVQSNCRTKNFGRVVGGGGEEGGREGSERGRERCNEVNVNKIEKGIP